MVVVGSDSRGGGGVALAGDCVVHNEVLYLDDPPDDHDSHRYPECGVYA